MSKVYVVSHESGMYEDRYTATDAVYDNLEAAQEHVQKRGQVPEREGNAPYIGSDGVASWSYKLAQEIDPSYDYYYVIEEHELKSAPIGV